jgi:hypothetical protein
MTAPRRRIVRPPIAHNHSDQKRQRQLQKLRARLEHERAALGRNRLPAHSQAVLCLRFWMSWGRQKGLPGLDILLQLRCLQHAAAV